MKTFVEKKISQIGSGWYIWLFPLIALIITVTMITKYYEQNGSTISISFSDVANIEVEKTQVRFRGVSIGTVKEIKISGDNKNVLVHVLLLKDAKHFAVQGSKFWIVSPKINIQGISGLETLFQGAYIAVQPGSAENEFASEFKGQMTSDITDPLENTTAFQLETNNAESINAGDNVSYRGLNIGTVTSVALSKTAQTVLIQINIQNRYTKLIRTNTAFWRKVGIQAKLSLFNSEIKVNSLDSIMRGGIELFTPDPPAAAAKTNYKFTLLPAAPKNYDKWNPVLK